MHPEIVVWGATATPRTLGWRHAMTWRQLSLLWQIPVGSKRNASAGGDVVHSVAVSRDEDFDRAAFGHCLRSNAASVVFLDRVRLLSGGSDTPVTLADADVPPTRSWRHVFRVTVGHPLVQGIPQTVTVYGRHPHVTPVDIDRGAEILLRLNDVPIIAYRHPVLLVGADPWQLGTPSVPMLYAVLSNWLTRVRGRDHHVPEAVAALRLDDLPATGEELRAKPLTAALDRRRARTLARLRRFALGTGARFTLMYTSHWRDAAGRIVQISESMPRSVAELRAGLEQDVFEMGSHGMTHLREAPTTADMPDGREFADLDEEETEKRLRVSADEIVRVFGIEPETFVAPVWAYRPGVTKRVASRRFRGIADASYRVESGRCDVLFSPGDEGNYMNLTETFRAGPRMLSYGDSDFWRCYAAAGIPVHYMQHSETNWHILRDAVTDDTARAETEERGLIGRLLTAALDPRRPRPVRVATVASLMVRRATVNRSSWTMLRRATTRSSIYAFARAIKAAGYRSSLLSELIAFGEKNRHRG